MKKLIGTCGKSERYTVWWVVGDFVVIPDLNVRFVTDTRDRKEALAICHRNLLNFAEA